MNATISLNSVTLADVPFNGLGHVAVSGGRKPIAHQRARFTVDADQRCCTAGLIEQVPDLAKIADALLAQQRVHVRGGQAGPGKFTILDLASGDKDPGRMVNDAGDPAMPQADDGHRKHQDRLDRYPAETARLADQFQQLLHPLRSSPARVPAGPGLRSGSPEPKRSESPKLLYLRRNAAVLTQKCRHPPG